MRLFLRKEVLTDTLTVDEIQKKLLEALSKREELRHDIKSIENEKKKREHDVGHAQEEMQHFHRNFVLLPEPEAPPKSSPNFGYWRGVDAHHRLEDAKAIKKWEDEEILKIPPIES